MTLNPLVDYRRLSKVTVSIVTVIEGNCKNPSLVLKVPSCKTSSFQSSFFDRIVPLWSYVCKIACPADLRSLTMFKSFLLKTYVQLLVSSFNVDMPCTWSLYRSCSCHRSYYR